MKKLFLAAAVLALVCGGAFALELPVFGMAAGGGAYFTSDFGGGVEGYGVKIKTPYYGGGVFAFFDATYVEASLGFFYGAGTMDIKNPYPNIPIPSGKFDFSVMGLDIGVMGKFPFTMNERLSLFPLLGFTYRIALSVKVDGNKEDDPGDYSSFWFKFGGGLDYLLSERLFLRASATYGVRTKNDAESDWSGGGIDSRLGHGLEVKVGVGYKF